MKTLGLNDLLNVIGMATLNGDNHFSEKMKILINEKIGFNITDEDYEYIINNYSK